VHIQTNTKYFIEILGEPFLSAADNNIDALKVEREIYERCQKGKD
jgi:hypothetical protein